MIDSLIQFDKQAFVLINGEWQNGFLDLICPFMRTQSNWYLAYAVVIYFLFNTYGKKAWYLLLTVGIAILVSDQLSGNLIKHAVERLRPCNDPAMSGQVRLLVHCGSGFSFVSSHAANHFTAAFFMATVLAPTYRWIWPLALFWAAFISYSQVYVGVHFPLDICCGALLGISIGLVQGWVIKKFVLTTAEQKAI